MGREPPARRRPRPAQRSGSGFEHLVASLGRVSGRVGNTARIVFVMFCLIGLDDDVLGLPVEEPHRVWYPGEGRFLDLSFDDCVACEELLAAR